MFLRMLMQRNKKKSVTWWRREGKKPCWWTEYHGGSSRQVSFCSTSCTGLYLEITTSGEAKLWAWWAGYQYFLKCRHYRYIYLCIGNNFMHHYMLTNHQSSSSTKIIMLISKKPNQWYLNSLKINSCTHGFFFLLVEPTILIKDIPLQTILLFHNL